MNELLPFFLADSTCCHFEYHCYGQLWLFIYSILDQQQKQSIPFQGGQCMGEFDGRIFISSANEIYVLAPVAIEKQV